LPLLWAFLRAIQPDRFESGVQMKYFGKKNYLGLGLAAVLLVVGFFLLGQKPANNSLALNVAPFVLLFAYLVVIPWSLWKGGDKASQAEGKAEGGAKKGV
jgi:hypothetical protein